jgi:NSS family neurotransmitter:Na+ symporter
MPALNKYSTFKVGKTWSIIIKYVLPIFLIVIWTVGIIKLFSTAKSFEIMVDIIIIAAVMVFAFVFTRIKPASE